MGQIAEDMLDGSCCQLCGCYFRSNEPDAIYCHEYPVVCRDCWNDLSDAEHKQYIRADVETF